VQDAGIVRPSKIALHHLAPRQLPEALFGFGQFDHFEGNLMFSHIFL